MVEVRRARQHQVDIENAELEAAAHAAQEARDQEARDRWCRGHQEMAREAKEARARRERWDMQIAPMLDRRDAQEPDRLAVSVRRHQAALAEASRVQVLADTTIRQASCRRAAAERAMEAACRAIGKGTMDGAGPSGHGGDDNQA